MASYEKRGIKDHNAHANTMMDFGLYSKVIRGATDIDLFYERNGNFLILEGKRVGKKAVSDGFFHVTWGQWKALIELDKALSTGHIFILAERFNGKTKEVDQFQMFKLTEGEGVTIKKRRLVRFDFKPEWQTKKEHLDEINRIAKRFEKKRKHK